MTTEKSIVTAVGGYTCDMLTPIFLELHLNSGHILQIAPFTSGVVLGKWAVHTGLSFHFTCHLQLRTGTVP